ncbi:hypothetical protein DL96DRAFT_1702996 [Flagelloscypha sp. PMI_526]|nr:hypothetical protein DL96DRAFT_1702996 [Flagelloscypha sp. PMI_526]
MPQPQRGGTQDPHVLVELIVEKESEHAGLIKALDDLQPAIASLELKKGELSEVEKELDDCGETLKMLAAVTKKDQRSLQSAAAGTMSLKVKRMFTKGNSFLHKQEEKKNRFVHSLNMESREREREERLTRRKATLQEEILAFTRQSDKFKSARTELELLYSSIFDGITPGYPEEDQAEAEVRAVQAIQTRVSANLSIEYSTTDVLRTASKAMVSCQEKLREALYWSSALILANSPETSRLRAQSLAEAHTLASDCRSGLLEARELCPAVKPFGSFTLAERPLVKTQSETAFHDIISQTATELDSVSLKITAELNSANLRIKAAGAVVEQTSKELRNRQVDLFKVRRKIFDQVIVDVQSAPEPSTSASSVSIETPRGHGRKPSWAPSARNPDPDEQDDPPVYSEAVSPGHNTDGPFDPRPLKPRYSQVPPRVNNDGRSATHTRRSSAISAVPLPPHLPLTETAPSSPASTPHQELPSALPSPPLTPPEPRPKTPTTISRRASRGVRPLPAIPVAQGLPVPPVPPIAST